MLRVPLESKPTGETKTYQFDFASDLASGETLSSYSTVATVYSGTDASPSSIISGSASASGSIVSQKITAGTVGVIYQLLCTAVTSASQTLQRSGYLAVIPPLP